MVAFSGPRLGSLCENRPRRAERAACPDLRSGPNGAGPSPGRSDDFYLHPRSAGSAGEVTNVVRVRGDDPVTSPDRTVHHRGVDDVVAARFAEQSPGAPRSLLVALVDACS